MKKILLCIVLCLFIVPALSSCHDEPDIDDNTKTYIIDVSGNEFVLSPEILRNDGIYKNKNAKSEYEITFYGTIYRGKYLRSRSSILSSYALNTYETDEYYPAEFRLRDGTNEFEGITFYNRVLYDDELYNPEVETPEEYAIKYAKRIAENYADVSNYTISVQKNYKNDKISMYIIRFEKYINGILSSDSIGASITPLGGLTSFSVNNVGVFDNKDISFSKDELKKQITTKVTNSYKKHSYNVVKQEITTQVLIVVQEQKMCIMSTVDVIIRKKLSSKEYESSLVLLTYLE